MTNHHAIMRYIRTVEETAPRTEVGGFQQLEFLADHWGGLWYLYHVVIGGRELWPVMNPQQRALIDGHAGWDMVTSRIGRGFDE